MTTKVTGKHEEKPATLVRIDKNLANNPEAIAVDFRNNDELATSLLIYAAYQFKNNLFAFGTIDPADFAKKMGFAPKYLTSVHPNPACFEGWTTEQIAKAYKAQEEHPEDPMFRIFDSRFENALYLLASRNVMFRRPGKTYVNQNGISQELVVNSVRLLKEFSITFLKSKQGRKRLIYSYGLDPGFIQNLSRLYVTADIDDFTMLRKKALHKLYLYVKNLRETAILNKNPRYTCQFDLLCEVAGIGSSQARDKKIRLIKAFADLKKVLKIDLDFTSQPGSRWAYVPVIIFREVENIDKLLPADKSDPILEKVDIFLLNFMHAVVAEYKEIYGYEINISEHNVQLLEGVIFNFLKGKDREKIESWYFQAQLQTFGKIGVQTKNNFQTFYNELQGLNTYRGTKEFLHNLFSSQDKTKPPLSLAELRMKYKDVVFCQAQVNSDFIKKMEAEGRIIVNISGHYYLCKN